MWAIEGADMLGIRPFGTFLGNPGFPCPRYDSPLRVGDLVRGRLLLRCLVSWNPGYKSGHADNIRVAYSSPLSSSPLHMLTIIRWPTYYILQT